MQSTSKITIEGVELEITAENIRALIQNCTDSADVAALTVYLKAAKNQLTDRKEYKMLYEEFVRCGERIITNPYDPFGNLFKSDCYELAP